jgi:hypothetical protein
MQIERGKAFIEHEPELTAEEVERARIDGKIVVSFKIKPVLVMDDIGFVAVKFVLSNGTPVTMLLDRLGSLALAPECETARLEGSRSETRAHPTLEEVGKHSRGRFPRQLGIFGYSEAATMQISGGI